MATCEICSDVDSIDNPPPATICGWHYGNAIQSLAEAESENDRLTRERDEWKAKANESATVRRLETMLLDSMKVTEQAVRERDEARAEADGLRKSIHSSEEWSEDDYIAANERLRARVAELEAEVGEWQRQAGKYAEDAANLERGLAAYRQYGHWHVEDAHGADADLSGYGPCGVCAWEREQREEARDAAQP